MVTFLLNVEAVFFVQMDVGKQPHRQAEGAVAEQNEPAKSGIRSKMPPMA